MSFATELLISFVTQPKVEDSVSLTQLCATLFRNLISKSDFLFPLRNGYRSNFWVGIEMAGEGSPVTNILYNERTSYPVCFEHHLISLHIIQTVKSWTLQLFPLWNVAKRGSMRFLFHCLSIILSKLTLLSNSQDFYSPIANPKCSSWKKTVSFLAHLFSAKASSGVGELPCASCLHAKDAHTGLCFLEENRNVWAKETLSPMALRVL